MKKIYYLALVVFSLFFIPESKAQISVNLNIGTQPLWGPVGYDYVRYYYMPEVNAYYNVSNRKYTYRKGNKWVTKSNLPREYKRFDLYRTYKVVINEYDPWLRHNQYHNRYKGFANNHSQMVIRDKRKKANGNKHREDRRRYDSRDHKKDQRPHRDKDSGRR